MRNTLLSVLAAAALPAAIPAAEMSFEGRWLLDGHPQESVDSTCEVRFYDAADAAMPAATATAVPFRTDSDGYFAVQADVPAGMPDAFWAGVKPNGADEIVPRMCVAPVPYALAADEAVLVTNELKLVLSGAATVERLVAAGNASVDQWTIPPGGTVKTKNLQASSARLVDVSTRPGAALGLFPTDGVRISPDYDAARGDTFAVEISQPSVFTTFTGHKLETRSYTPDRDSLLLVALTAGQNSSDVSPRISLTVGGTKIVDLLDITSPEATAAWNYPFGGKKTRWWVTKRFLCVPVRAGETAEVALRAYAKKEHVWNGTTTEYKTTQIGAKVLLVPFGRQ